MRYVIALLLIIVSSIASAQTDTSYHLLWFKGKKIKPNVLLTSSGDSVFYNPAKGAVKVKSKTGYGKKMDNMLAELDKTPQRMQQMLSRLAKMPKPILPTVALQIKRSFEEVEKDYRPLLTNVITLPEISFPESKPLAGKGPAADYVEMEEDPWEEVVKEFRQFRIDHANDQFVDVPVPPATDYTYCYPCQIEKQKNYQKEMEHFLEELRGGDNAIVLKAFGVVRQAEFLLNGEKYDRVSEEATNLIKFIFARMVKRVKVLIDKYIDDPVRSRAVLEVGLSTDRQYQLSCFGDEPLPDGFIERGIKSMMSAIEKAINEEDYSIALNLQLIFSSERQLQLLAMGQYSIIEKAMNFNQFKLNMNVSAKIGNNGGYQLAQVKGDNWYFASPDTNCHLRWIQVGPYLNKAKSELLAAEIKGDRGEIKYAGTKEWASDIPSIKVDFWGDHTDSVIAYPFHADKYEELWQFPQPIGVKNLTQMNNVLVGCFIDVDRLKQDAATYKNPENVEKLKKEMMAKYEGMMKDFKSGNSKYEPGMSIQEMGTWAGAQQKGNKISELIHSANPGRYIFQPVVHNKDKVIFKDKINGKVTFPENTATEYAWFHLALEHDPDGPYKTTF